MTQPTYTAFGIEKPASVFRILGQLVWFVGFVVISWGMLVLVWSYGNGLRDPRYLDGWLIACGMLIQILFHIAKAVGLSPKSWVRWRKIHVFVGYLIIVGFVCHSDFSLPDSGFEWILWLAFVVVSASGLFGTYLLWLTHSKRPIKTLVNLNQIPSLRAELRKSMLEVASETGSSVATMDLPELPHEDWINEFCETDLSAFFNRKPRILGHLIGSQRYLSLVTDAIDNLARYVDQAGKTKLATLKTLAIEKDRLDFMQVSLGLSRGWLFVHVPITYSLLILTIVHIVVVYSFSSGIW
jgi:hypothetical protein